MVEENFKKLDFNTKKKASYGSILNFAYFLSGFQFIFHDLLLC